MAFVGCADGDLSSDVLLCNVGAAWRMTVKQSTHTITEQCADGQKTSLTYSSSILHSVWVEVCIHRNY